MPVGGVDDLEQDVGARDLLERGAERVDQLVRQLVDEAHRVGDDHRLAVAELHRPAGGIERGEEAVLGARRLRAGQRVEQRGLAGVRVADDGDRRHQPAVAGAGRRLALPADHVDAFLELLDALADDPAVGLQLRLARAAGADAAAGARKVRPQARQARQLVLELRQLHLEPPSWVRACCAKMSRIRPGAVQDLDAEQRLEAALLVRRQLVVRRSAP